jgi:hypothetical protein
VHASRDVANEKIEGVAMRMIRFIAPLALSAFIPAALAQEAPPIFIVPLQGQDEAQINQDKAACEMWTYEQIGFPEGYVPPENTDGKVAKNAAIGTVGGAAIGAGAGAIGGKPGVGAAAGAGAGLIAGLVIGSKKKKKAKEEAAAQQAEITAYNDNYRRAMTACLSARGYQVS